MMGYANTPIESKETTEVNISAHVQNKTALHDDLLVF